MKRLKALNRRRKVYERRLLSNYNPFWLGFAAIFDFSANTFDINTNKIFSQTPMQALEQDWQNIGKDMGKSCSKFVSEYEPRQKQ